MKKTKSLIISAMIMVFALVFTACGSKSSSVEGSWSGNDNGYDVVFNFEADGQGTMQLSGIQLNITYSVDGCLLYTSDAADDLIGVDLGGRRIIKKKIFSSRRRHTRCLRVSWARRCV